MATYTAEELRGQGTLTEAISGATSFEFTFPSSLSGSAYFTFETKRNVTGSYDNVTALGKGDKEVGVNSSIVIKPTGSAYETGYIWSAKVRDGGSEANNVITWTPAVNVGVGTAYLRGTGGISVNVV